MAHAPDRPPETTASAREERELVEGLLAGETRAISDLLERTHHRLYGMACRLTRDSELRRDWAHTTLLGVLDDLKLGRFVYGAPGSFWAWFRTRAHLGLFDRYRLHQQTARHEVTTQLEPGVLAIEAADSLPGLDDASLSLKTDGEIGEAERSLLLLRQRIGLETPAAPQRREAREPEGWFEHLIADLRGLIPDRRWALVPIALAAMAFVALWPRPSGDPLLVRDLQLVPESEVRGAAPGWHTGEAFTLRFELTSPGKVVVFHVGPNARPSLLYPFATDTLATNEAAGPIVLPPPARGIEWRLEGESGPEHYVVAAGARGTIDLAALVAEAAVLDSVGESSASVSQSLERLLESRVGPVRSIEIQHLR